MSLRSSLRTTLTLLSFGLVACTRSEPTEDPDQGGKGGGGPQKIEERSGPPPTTGPEGLLASMDQSADPCVDFYQYACGGWLEQVERPADRPRYVRSFDTVSENNEALLKALLEEAEAAAKAGSSDPVTQKLGDYYGSCMDLPARDAAGAKPIEPYLAKIDGIETRDQLMVALGELHRSVWGRIGWLGMPAAPPFFIVGIEADYMQAPDKVMAVISQAGLALPSRSMYLPPEGPEGEGGRALLAAYEKHISNMLALAGTPAEQAAIDAKAVLAIEIELAKSSLTPVQLRDDEANYHKDGFAGLEKRAKGVAWKAYFAAAGLPMTKQINLRTPDFLAAAAKLIQKRDLAELKAYLRWTVLHATAADLDSRFAATDFEFAQMITGVTERPPQWKICTQQVMWALPDLIGQRFVDKAFAGESKAIANDMIDRINAAMAAGFPALAWMDETTRGRAADKIAKVSRKIGYPDEWQSYADVAIGKDVFFANVIAEKQAYYMRDMALIGQPVDRKRWFMPPPLVNAYYNPTNNEIAFPAGILQPPFFDADQPMVMNFGGIGAVAGHELTHGFDDEGRKYDASGRLTQWWEPPVSAAFEERVACVEQQYSAYEVLPGKFINGELTAGENIADLGGVKEAYFAYKTWEAEQPERAKPAIEGLSNDQAFFVAWAQNWCSHTTDAELLRRNEADPHSPGKYRAVGPLVTLPEFAQAFECTEGTPMNPPNRCEVW